MIKGIIFDLDGVICSTDEFHFLAWLELAKREGIYFDRQINNRLRGVSRMASLDIVLERANKDYTQDEKVEMATYKNDIYRKLLNNMDPSYILEGVKEVLTYAKEHSIKIAIGSSSKNTKTILERIGLLNEFDAIADGTDIKNSKPDPEVFLLAASRINESPSDCIVVEDAFAGIEAANKGGFISVAVGDATKDETAKYHLDSLLDILPLLK